MNSSFCPDCYVEYFGAEEFCSSCGGSLSANAPEAVITEDAPAESVVFEADDVVSQPDLPITSALAAALAKAKAKLDRYERSATGKAGDAEAAAGAEPSPSSATTGDIEDHLQSVLPPHEREEQGWRIVGAPLNSPKSYEQWPIAKMTTNGEVRAVFRRFTTGALCTRQTYEAVLNAAANAKGTMASLYSYGTVHVGGGARRDYEIAALPVGQTLPAWLQEKGQPGVDPARYLAPLLAGFLKRLQDLGLRPITLDPDMLFISAEHGITLGVLGALALRGNGDHFCADLANSALLTLPYAAPELIGRRVIADTTETFAAGQILSAALFGETQDHEFIGDGSVPFAAIGDNVLEAVLMGTLWPHPDGRWSVDQLGAALVPGATELPKRPPWKSLRPGAAKAAFNLGGEDFFLAEDLLDAVAEHWDEAAMRCDEILDWLEKGTRFKGQAGLLRQQRRAGRSVDWALLRLRRLIVPKAPIVWRGHALDDADAENSLINLAQQALAEGEDAAQAQDDLQRLFDADLHGAFTFTVNSIGKENTP